MPSMALPNASAFRFCRRILSLWCALVVCLSCQDLPGATACESTPCIFYAQADRVSYVDAHNVSAKEIVVSDLSEVRALAVFVRRNLVFWSEYDALDLSQTKIRRLDLQSMEGTDIVSGVGEVRGIAIEWVNELIYWTDYMRERIEVARIDGSHRKTLIWDAVLNPKAIVVDPGTGYLFWSELGWDYPKIERATLAGTDRQVLVNLRSSDQLLANGLTIDHSSRLLYWIDAETGKIQQSNFNGSEIQTLITLTIFNMYPYSMTMYEDMLYFSDYYSRSIERVNVTSEEHEMNMGWFGGKPVFDIALFDSSVEPPGMTDCQSNSNCSHLCLLAPSGPQCACPNGYNLLGDGLTCIAVGVPTSPPIQDIEVRLVNNSIPSELEGRIEVRLPGGDWGTICDDHFDARDANVVCHMLHYESVERVVYSASYVYGFVYDEDAVSILLDNLKCRGDESSLMECRHRGWNVSNCGHIEDVGVVCKNGSYPTAAPNVTTPTPGGPPPNVTVTLRGGAHSYEGRVEIYHDGRWGTICGNDFDIDDANVICRMLGHHGAWSTYCCGWYGYGSGEIWLDSVRCTGNESSIAECSHGGWGGHSDVCTHYDDVGVYCIPNMTPPSGGNVRLVEGTSPNEGRVEIFHEGEWGTICDDGWDLQDATVVCRMLNYSGALAAPMFSAYNSGSGKIWLDSLQCQGNESSIEDCLHGGWDNHDCSHNEDAGVICKANDSALPVYDARNSLMLAEIHRGILFHVDLDASPPVKAPLPIDRLMDPTAIGYDPVEKKIYYAEAIPGIIRRSYLNGTDTETIINGIYYANRIAIDYVRRNIYYTDSSRYRIDVANLDGRHRMGLISTPWPEGVALDIENGYIYWTSTGFPPRIERADMDGRNILVLLNLTSDSYPSGITLDSSNGRLYWTDLTTQQVSYYELSTRQHGPFISPDHVHAPLDVAIHQNTLYLTDAGTGDEWDGGVYSALLGGTGNVTKVIDLLKYPWGLETYAEASVMAPADSGCGSESNECSHLCLGSPTNAHCACPPDMELVNVTTCDYRTPLILHTECYYSEIYKAPLGGDDLFSLANTLPLEHVSCPHAIASDTAERKLYWTDLVRKHIARANLDGTDEEVIVQNVSYSMGLAVDSYAGNIYFTDRDKRTVEVAKHDGRFRHVLIHHPTHDPVGLAIDPKRGYMYYSAWGSPPVIERAELDGTNRIRLVEFPAWSNEGPTALALDLEENVLYWVGVQDPSLAFIDLRYPHNEIVYHIDFHRYLHYPYGLALDAYYFYWTDSLLGNVVRASRDLYGATVALIPYQYTPGGVNIFNPGDVQVQDACASECSQLCLRKPGGYKCACPEGAGASCNETTVIRDEYGCQEDPSLYYITHNEIGCIDLKTLNHFYVNKKIVKNEGIIEGAAIDIDHQQRMLYWADNSVFTISRMSLVSGENEVILRDLGQVEALAVEWESGLLYWTDYIYETIEVAKLDGKYRKTLINSGLFNPRGIAVDPFRGYMFWTVWGFDLSRPKIHRADLTGRNRVELVDLISFFNWHLLPMGVAIDFGEQLLYWMDAYMDQMDSVNYYGGDRQNIHFVSENISPRDVALYGEMLFWADYSSRSIHWINKTRPSAEHSFGHLSDDIVMGAVVSDISRQPPASPMNRPPCAVSNGGCSQLCLSRPGGWMCACANGVTMSEDGVTCNNVTQPTSQPPPLPDVMVRLLGSNNSHEGRVEVGLMLNGTRVWGSICDDHWGIKEGNVICRMLNFTGAKYFTLGAYFGQSDIFTPILMDNVKCRGDEHTIAACRHDGWGLHNCVHSDDAGVICRTDNEVEPTLAPGPHPELRVRLRGGPTSNQGRVEIYLNGTWGTICDDNWGIEEANVICRMLNYTEGAWTTQCCGWYDVLSAPDQIWLDDVRCDGTETSIARCRHGGWGEHNCGHYEDVGIVCKFTPPPTPDQKLRLADGVRKGEGRVEIFNAGHWGTVCDDSWGIEDAKVVCRELGYYDALGAPRMALFGEGNGHIWLDDVNCVGNETSIEDCQHNGWNIENCRHREDASVICVNGSANTDAEDFLLTCEDGRNLCYFIPLGLNASLIEVPLKLSTTNPRGVAYDPIEKRIYWADSDTVVRAFLNGSSVEVIMRGLSEPMGIAIDSASRNIYVADLSGNKIEVARLDGSYQTTLLRHSAPVGIALDNSDGYIYFSSTGAVKQILRANMDGTNQSVLANLSSIGGGIVDVVLDKPRQRLFFSDQSNEEIRYIDLETREVHVLLSGNLHGPVGLTLFRNTLYWTGWGYGGFSGAIFKAEATNGTTARMVDGGYMNPNGIFAHDSEAPSSPASSCQNNGDCVQICVPIPTGRQCLCQNGMKLAANRKDCTLEGILLMADSVDGAIYMAPLNDSSINTLVALPFENVERPFDVAFDPFEMFVYWTEIARGVVVRSDLAGAREEVIRSNFTGVIGVAVDPDAGNAYWINRISNTIEVARLNGDHLKVLVIDVHPESVAIALDTTRGLMYWSARGVIEGAEMDGSNRKVIALLETWWGFYDAKGLVVDVELNRLYFASSETDAIFYIDLDVGDGMVHTLFDDWFYVDDPFGVAVDEQYVYWNDYWIEAVLRTPKLKTESPPHEILVTGLYDPRGMVLQKGDKTRNTLHPCYQSNGNCSQLCLSKASGGHTCACSSQSDPNNPCEEITVTPPLTPYPTRPTSPTPAPSREAKGCSSPPCIYYADETSIWAINHVLSNTTKVETTLIVSNLLDARAIDVDVQENVLYWNDNALSAIRRVNLTSGNVENVVTEYLGYVEAIAVEWESGLLYWTDSAFKTIEVARHDGSFHKTLIRSNLEDPRAIAVDPRAGYLYFSDKGTYAPGVERSYLDGTERELVIYYFFYTPIINSLTIDYDYDRLYWIDTYDNSIMSSNLDGSSHNMHQLFYQNLEADDIDIMGDTAFFSDRNSHSIERVNKTYGQHLLNFGWLSENPVHGLAVFDSSRQPQGMKSCRQNNGGCSHLCLLTPMGRTCTCPNGMNATNNGTNCTSTPTTPRPPVQALEIRLMGGNASNEGRVELRKPEGSWGTVCTDLWEIEDARVACHMLRYEDALFAVTNGAFGKGQGPIWLDDLACSGSEVTLAECHSNGWGNALFSCSSELHAGVICKNASLNNTILPPLPTVPSGIIPDVKVRLQNGLTFNQGRVEVFYNNAWRGICDQGWDILDADVVCKMLNFTGAWSTQCCGWYRGGTGHYWLSNVGCLGNEDTIAKCRHSGWGVHTCPSNSEVGVYCKYTPTEPQGSTIRLADGLHMGEGRVEVFFQGHWGTVCDDSWDIEDADVVCRMLNYSRAISAVWFAGFGRGNGHIFLDDVECNGNERSIEDCGHKGIDVHNCNHGEDAGVVCDTGNEPNYDATYFMLYTDAVRGLIIHRAFGDVSGGDGAYLPIRESLLPMYLTYDQENSQVFWSDQYSNKIYRSNLNGNSYQVFTSSVGLPAGLSFDKFTKMLYFADTKKGVVQVSSVDGTLSKVIAAGFSPVDIALDASRGVLYCISNNPPQIRMVPMSGTNQTILVNLTGNSDPQGIDLDVQNQRLFWTERGNKHINYIDLNDIPLVPKTLVSDNYVPVQTLAGVSVDSTTLYWIDRGTGEWSGDVFKTDKQTAANVTKFGDYLRGPVDVFVNDPNVQITPVSTACQTNNGGCSHLCLLHPDGHQCRCPMGMLLNENRTKCVTEDLIVYADMWDSQLYATPLTAQDPISSRYSLPVENIDGPLAVAIDQQEGRVYWTDTFRYHISCSYLDGRSEVVVVEDPDESSSFNGIAVDVVSRHLYWTSYSFYTGVGRIEVARLDGSYKRTLVTNYFVQPFDIVVDPTRGYFYWATESYSSSEHHAIYRADMDGSNIRAIIELEYWDYFWGGLYGLALDVDANLLYWIGYHETVIQYVDLNTASQGPLTDHIQDLFRDSDYLWDPYGLTLHNGYLYWTDQDADVVARVNQTTGKGFTVMADGLSIPRGIDVYYQVEQVSHPCNQNNGGCTHLCLIIPNGYKCACPSVTDPSRQCFTTPITPSATPTSSSSSTVKSSSAVPTPSSSSTVQSSSAVPTPSSSSTVQSSSVVPTPSSSSTVQSSSAAPTQPPSTDYCGDHLPCQNGGSCVPKDNGYFCECAGVFVGENCTDNLQESGDVIQLELTIVTEEGSDVHTIVDSVISSIVDFLNEKCAADPAFCPPSSENAESRKKRDTVKGPYTAEDVRLTNHPKIVDGKVNVEFVVVKTTDNGTTFVLPGEKAIEVIEENKEELGNKVGATVTRVKQMPPPTPTPTPTERTETGGKNTGLIAGVIVAVAVLLIIAALGVWYFRVRRQSVPYVLDKEEENTNTRVSAFENPGYDSTGVSDGPAEGTFRRMTPMVDFAPYEEVKESGAVNPLYAEIDMENMGTSSNPEGKVEHDMVPVYENVTAGSLEKKPPPAADADKLPVKVPLDGDEAVSGGKETQVEKNPPVASLPLGKCEEPGAKHDEVGITVDEDSNPRYTNLASLKRTSPAKEAPAETVVSIEETPSDVQA